jgi:hypothetical protein
VQVRVETFAGGRQRLAHGSRGPSGVAVTIPVPEALAHATDHFAAPLGAHVAALTPDG